MPAAQSPPPPRKFFAIAHDLASPVVDQMKNGDVESIGINGWAVFDEALGVSGIWVAGVSAGSPAAEADILPGDIITSLNGLPMGTDGTFKDYCDALRTAGPGQPMAVEVLRWDTSEVLAGEINGDEPLALTVSLAEEVEEDVDTEASGPATYSEYESVTDDTGTITVSVPVEWSERDTVPAEIDGEEIPYIAAATSLDGFLNGYTDPGLLYIALDPSNDVDGTLAENAFGNDCEDGGIERLRGPGVHRQVPEVAGVRRWLRRPPGAGGATSRRLGNRADDGADGHRCRSGRPRPGDRQLQPGRLRYISRAGPGQAEAARAPLRPGGGPTFPGSMTVIPDSVVASSDAFASNREAMLAHVAELERLVAEAVAGGGEEYVARHRSRGKLLARERIDRLVDPDSPFLELSPIAAPPPSSPLVGEW